MNDLRLILLMIGAVIVVGVYLYSRSQSRERGGVVDEPSRDGTGLNRAEDPLDDDLPEDLPPLRATDDELHEPADGEKAGGVVARTGLPGSEPQGASPPIIDDKIIALNILPREPGDLFLGSDLLDVFDRAGLEYGLYNVFHRLVETDEGPETVFSIASATEPGSFDITRMEEQEFRGLSLFMVLPGPMRGVDAFADMLATARRIAEQIRGEVKDRSRSTLTRQTAHHIREEIIEFELRLQSTS